MALFDQSIINLFLTQFLPFILIFAFLYALLQKSRVLGGGKSGKMLNMLVSVAIAAMVVFVNPLNINWAVSFANMFSGTTVIAVFLAFVVLFAIMFSAASGKPMSSTLVLLVAVALGIVGLGVSGILPQLWHFDFVFDLSQYSVYIVIGIFAAIIFIIMRMFTKPEESGKKKH